MLKRFPGPTYLYSKAGVVWLLHDLVSLYIWLTILLRYSSIILVSGLIGRDEVLITLCHSCGFACQERVLKTFAGADYPLAKDGVVWLWLSHVSLHILLTIWSCHSSIPSALGLIGRDGGLSPLCHTCGFVCPQSALKTFHSHGYIHSKDGVVWPWQSLVNMYIWLTILSCYSSVTLALGLIWRDVILSALGHSCGFAC